VRYDELAPMLLNEVQQQHAEMTAKIDAQAAQIAMQASQLSELKQQIAQLQEVDRTMQAPLQAKDKRVAQR
jgi:cell division protein FtsL